MQNLSPFHRRYPVPGGGGGDGAEVVVCSVGLSVQHEELFEGHLEECEGGVLPWGQCGVVP